MSLNFSVSLGRNNWLNILAFRFLNNCIGIVTSIRQQIIRLYPFNKAISLCTISCGTACDNNSHRQTMRIHGQMYLGVEPPFVRPMSWLPPLAPAAWGWTLIWLASIMSHSQSGSFINSPNNLSHIPLSLQRQNRRCVFFQSPKSGGKSLHGAPVRKIQNTALMNSLLSFASPPQEPFCPGRWWASNSQVASDMSWRLCGSAVILFNLLLFTSVLF